MKKICFAIYDMGAGHRSTANALREVIEQIKLPWQIEIVEVYSCFRKSVESKNFKVK